MPIVPIEPRGARGAKPESTTAESAKIAEKYTNIETEKKVRKAESVLVTHTSPNSFLASLCDLCALRGG